MNSVASYTKEQIESLISVYVSVVDRIKSSVYGDNEPSLNHELFVAEEALKALNGSGPSISKANSKYVDMCVDRGCYVGEVNDGIGTIMIEGSDNVYVWVPVLVSRSEQDAEAEFEEL